MYFDQVKILGYGYAGALSAAALARAGISSIIYDKDGIDREAEPNDYTGKQAHSHIFLPRMERDVGVIAPELLEALKRSGLEFGLGSEFVSDFNCVTNRRLMAGRAQVDGALNAYVQDHTSTTLVPANIWSFELSAENDFVTGLITANGQTETVPDTCLVIDASTMKSGLLASLAKQLAADGPEVGDTGIAYFSQFWRRKPGAPKLPDALAFGKDRLSDAFVSLFPARGDLFSVTAVIYARNMHMREHMRDAEYFLKKVRSVRGVATWLDYAEPVSEPKMYLNPKNSWNVGFFDTGNAPLNYVAVGDALVSTNPVLGAGVSFASTHVRAMIENLPATEADVKTWHTDFAAHVTREQRAFFERALLRDPRDLTFKQMAKARIRNSMFNILKLLPGVRRVQMERALKVASTL